MRNQTIRQKHKNTIKNIAPQRSLTHVITQISPNDPEQSVGFEASHDVPVLERKNKENSNGREDTSFQQFLRSIPRFRSKALSTPGKCEKSENSFSAQSIENNEKQLTIKKISSFQEELGHVRNIKDGEVRQNMQTSDKDNKQYKSHLNAIRKRNENNLMMNIEKLRKKQQSNIKKEPKSSDLFNKLSKTGDKSIDYNFVRKGKAKEIISLDYLEVDLSNEKANLKQKMMNKISRRHIYHTLKHKSQVLQKVKAKSLHHSEKMAENVESDTDEAKFYRTFRLNYAVNQKNMNSLHYKQLRIRNQCWESEEPLRINSKQAHIESPSRIRAQNPSHRKIAEADSKGRIKINTLGTLSPFNMRRQCEENFIADCLDSEMLDAKIMRKKKEKMSQHQNGRENIFRELTPWRASELEHDFSDY